MEIKNYTKEEMEVFNSITGNYFLLKKKKINLDKVLEESIYVETLKKKQEELIKLQNWVIKNKKKVVVLFEGRDAAGKRGGQFVE